MFVFIFVVRFQYFVQRQLYCDHLHFSPFQGAILSMPYWQRNVNHGLSLVMCHFPCHIIICERSNLQKYYPHFSRSCWDLFTKLDNLLRLFAHYVETTIKRNSNFAVVK
ncbi:hypothetical protein NP493_40g05024 [Ridgeia piscesae]|uniref:Uncharacterized protein n=1 Tax=Ridgeia piscesae TaxID=27915 RepID=A0AAD9UJZ0_RIDPI|nr:hypothetical protein NP493_40g05024 [Ridgeia piscesae]